MSRRLVPFMIIAALGLAVQVCVMVLLQPAGLPLALSTVIAVECAVLHNFVWHERWTWEDRHGGPLVSRLMAFHASNGLSSVTGNVLIGQLLTAFSTLGMVTRTIVAVLLTGALNFVLADRLVFTRRAIVADGSPARHGGRGTVKTAGLAAAVFLTASAVSAGPSTRAVAEWDRLIAATEASIAAAPRSIPAFNRPLVIGGRMDVHSVDASGDADGATVQRWRGAVLLPRVRLETVLQALTSSLPSQPDVIAARFISRAGDRMEVYLRLVRRAGLTVTYDTEHDVRIRRLTPRLAVSRSVMTRVREVSGAGTPDERVLGPDEDRGFLWRLNAYWWYEETPAGVIAVMETLTLSRDIPIVLRPVAAPFVRRVARESVTSALEGVRARFR